MLWQTEAVTAAMECYGERAGAGAGSSWLSDYRFRLVLRSENHAMTRGDDQVLREDVLKASHDLTEGLTA